MTIALLVCLVAAPAAGAARRAGGGDAAMRELKQLLRDAPKLHEVDLLFVPSWTTPADLAAAGFSPGLMSAGLGTVTPEQTYLDIGAGNRVFNSLYGDELPPRAGGEAGCRTWFREAVARAATAPDEIEPGLMIGKLRGAGVHLEGGGPAGCALGMGLDGGAIERKWGRNLLVARTTLGDAGLLARLPDRSLTIAIATPTGRTDEPIPIGIAGPGFDGNLTSDTTRTDGYVTSTDIAPTILTFFGFPIPSQMIGQAIRTEGSVDPGAVEARGARMAVVSERRGPVIGFSLLAWALAALLVTLLSRGALARPAVRLLGLSVIYLPLALLAGAALEPSRFGETLLVMLAAPALGALTLVVLRGYRALAVAVALTVVAYAVDAIAGSPLSALSLLGPNPGLGVRFYGIGNELESLLSVLIVGGIGAALAGFWPRLSPGRCAAAFLVVGIVLAGIFASGKFGADVGAAIDFPAGVAVAAVVITGGRRRSVVLVVLIPLIVLALLAIADLLSGANSHFTRSVLDAGGLHSLGDTAQRRLEQTAHSFVRPVLLVMLPVVALLVALAYIRRATLDEWVSDFPAMRAALIGGAVATVVATLANDSGALLLEIGAAYMLVFVGWAWAEAGRSPPSA